MQINAFDQTHRSSFGTLPHGAGCRAVNELVSRALFIGREIIPCGTILVNISCMLLSSDDLLLRNALFGVLMLCLPIRYPTQRMFAMHIQRLPLRIRRVEKHGRSIAAEPLRLFRKAEPLFLPISANRADCIMFFLDEPLSSIYNIYSIGFHPG